MSALLTQGIQAEGREGAAAAGEAALPAPFEAHRRAVLEAMRATRLPGRSLAALMTSYQLGWVDPAGDEVTGASGKLLRPALCLWACEVAGGTPSAALAAAMAVEWIHNFTLVHDDIQDGDRVRRHRPSVWALWGPEQGINAGDGLFARAFEILASAEGVSSERTVAALRVIAGATRRVIAGQCLDLALEGRPQTSPLAYLRMARLKTGALMGATLEAGAIFGGGGDAAPALRRAGELLGLAFQVRDDWLGVWGDAGRTGKPLGDLARRKVGYPVVAAYAAASDPQRLRFATLFETAGAESTGRLRELLEQLGGAELGSGLSAALQRKAVATIDRLGSPRRTAEFAELAEHLAARAS